MRTKTLDISKLPFSEIFTYFNTRNLKEYEDEWAFSCPFPEHKRGDTKPSSYINKETGAYYCHGCGRSGSIISFVAELEGVSYGIASRWLRDSYGAKYLAQQGETLAEEFEKILAPKKPPKLNQVLGESILKDFKVNWQKAYEHYKADDCPNALSYLFDRGFLPETLDEFQLGYDSVSKRITIPYRDKNGQLAGFKGRAISDEEQPKYKVLGSHEEDARFGRIKVSNYVFGLNSADNLDIIIVEGELDAIKLRQDGFTGAISCGRCDASKQQINQIREFSEKVTILFDSDEAGYKGSLKVANRLIQFLPVKIATIPESGKDPAQLTKKEIKQILNQSKSPLEIV